MNNGCAYCQLHTLLANPINSINLIIAKNRLYFFLFLVTLTGPNAPVAKIPARPGTQIR